MRLAIELGICTVLIVTGIIIVMIPTSASVGDAISMLANILA